MADTEWMTVDELAAYSKLSRRTLERAISQSFNYLPSYRVAGRRMVRRSEYDAWAMGMRKPRRRKARVIGGLRGAPGVHE
jgi:excisionase family DNA binding protein